jgi:hypothetical protein
LSSEDEALVSEIFLFVKAAMILAVEKVLFYRFPLKFYKKHIFLSDEG